MTEPPGPLADPDELDRPVEGRTRHLLGVPGGVVLFLALFLPAVPVCGKPYYPVAFPPVYPAYLLGLVAAIAVLQGTARSLRVAGWCLAIIVAIGWALLGLGIGSFAFDGRSVIGSGVFAAWAIAGAAVVAPYRRRDPWERRSARTIAVGALGSCTFFVALMFDDEGVLWGTWVALAGAATLLLGGIGWEVEVRHRFRDRVPRARVTRGGPAPG